VTALAAELVPQAVDAAFIAGAQRIYDNATGPGFRWSQENSDVTEALGELADAIGFYRRIATGNESPEGAYGVLCLPWNRYRSHEQRLSIALRMAAEESMAEADVVLAVIAEELGDGIAAEVRGEERGTR